MENESSQVESVAEPKVESRFGFKPTGRALSRGTVQFCAACTVLSLGAVLWVKNPEKPDLESGTGVHAPEAFEVSGSQTQVSVESYSTEEESNLLKEKNKKKVVRVTVKFPGLQKIDRTHVNQIPPGSEVKARLLTGASNGLVRAELIEPLRVRGKTFIAQGETLVGHGQSTEERLYIRFSQLVRRDGGVETIQAQAADAEDKTAGLKGSKFGRYAMKYGAAVGLNFVGGMTENLQEKTAVGQQAVAAPNVKNALLNGASRAAIEMANDTMSNIRNQPPPITIDAGQEILVIFEGTR